MKTGIVMECKGNEAVVLEAGGRFCSVRRREGWKPGDVVSFRTQIKVPRTVWTAAACLVLLFSGSLAGYRSYYTETMAISIDINPSIEFGINRFDKVVRLTAWNKEGEQILAQEQLKNKSVEEALEALFKNGAADYIDQDTYITYTVLAQAGAEEKEGAMVAELEAATDRILSSCHKEARVELYGVDAQLVEEAHAHHVSAGKYMALTELEEAVPDVDIDSYSHCSIMQIREKIVSSGGEIKEGGCMHHNSCSHKCYNE